jgi:predicted RNase H-like nuclease (RuvC/YqgF family)
MLDNLDIKKIDDLPSARKCILLLYNLVEEMNQENRELREQIQYLRDEISRLKGEQGKPDVKPDKKPFSSDCSSEK